MKRLLSLLILLTLSISISFAEERPLLAVLDFATESFSKSEMVAITSLITSEIFQSGRYAIIDAEQRNLILDEIEFSYSDCADERCQLEVGRMLSADFIVIGNISRLGSWLIISCKILEVETTQTIAIANGRYKNIDQFVEDVASLTDQLLGTVTVDTTPEEDSPDDTYDYDDYDSYDYDYTEEDTSEDYSDYYTDDSYSDYEYTDDFNTDFYSDDSSDNYYSDDSYSDDYSDDFYSDDSYSDDYSDDYYTDDSYSDDSYSDDYYTDDSYYSNDTSYDDQRSGLALEAQFGFAYNTTYMHLYGTFGLTYQFDDTFSLGFYGTMSEYPDMLFPGGIKLILGNKVDGIAIGLNLGFPTSISLYLENLIFSIAIIPVNDPIYLADIGYSLFLDDDELF